MLSISQLTCVTLECITFIKYAFYLAAANNRSVVKNFLGTLHPSGAASTENCGAFSPPLAILASRHILREAWHTGKLALAKLTF